MFAVIYLFLTSSVSSKEGETILIDLIIFNKYTFIYLKFYLIWIKNTYTLIKYSTKIIINKSFKIRCLF